MAGDTREMIMTTAKAVVQSHGYNALSFRELAKAVGVKSASVHYHFPTKGDLGEALARQYADDAELFFSALSLAPADVDITAKRYANAFRAALENDNRMCLCGIMIAEHDDLPDQVKVQVDRFTETNTSWLAKWLQTLTPDRAAEEIHRHAVAIFAGVEGAQLISRGKTDMTVFDQCIDTYRLTGLIPSSRTI